TTLIGRHLPLHATALGKAFLAGFDDDSVHSLAERGSFTSFTVNTITSIDDLLVNLEDVRRRGYSMENEELALGRGCIAAPIRGRNCDVVAAPSLCGPKEAIGLSDNDELLAVLLLDVTDRISGKRGFLIGSTSATPIPSAATNHNRTTAAESQLP